MTGDPKLPIRYYGCVVVFFLSDGLGTVVIVQPACVYTVTSLHLMTECVVVHPC